MFTCSVLPLTILPNACMTPPPLAATMLTGFSLVTDDPWPILDDKAYDLSSVRSTCCVVFATPFLRFAGVGGAMDGYTVDVLDTGTKSVTVRTFAPRLTFAGADQLATFRNSLTVVTSKRRSGPGLSKYDSSELAAYLAIETAVENMYRSLAFSMLDDKLATIAHWLFRHPENTGASFSRSNNVLEIKPEGVHPAIAAALLLLSARKRLVVIESASIDLFSREVKMALRPDAPNSQLAGVQGESNPAGAILRGAMRAYLGGGVVPMEHPILGVITEWSDSKPPRVEI